MRNSRHAGFWITVLLCATLTFAGCSGGPTEGAGPGSGITPANTNPGWFGGYLDVSLPQGPELANGAGGRTTTVLAFITADPAEPCTPTWGGTLGLEEAGTNLQLDAKIRNFRAEGNDVAASFGGQRGQELAAGCQDVGALADAYQAVIARYSLDVVDLDVEGQAAGSGKARLRAQAFAKLQADRPPGHPLRVWLTLPVTRDGLDSAGKNSVEAMLTAGVDLAGVNIMTMNFGQLRNGESILTASELAAEATYRDLEELYSNAGMPKEAGKMWRNIGLTPMIGENDTEANVFTLQDAAGMNSFARDRNLGRISFWSLTRDATCHAGVEEDQRPSSSCSGIDQDAGDFARILSNGFTGNS
ncbi:chitinase [Arthrobacter sp. SLBN-83]|nr:chitinase [Arthrobacter sp. SLBN-83]